MTLRKSLPSLSLFISNRNMILTLSPHVLILSEEVHYHRLSLPQVFLPPFILSHSYKSLRIEGTELSRTPVFKDPPE